MRGAHGISLIELLTVLALVAVLAAAGVPALDDLLLDSRMSSAVNAMVRAVHLARQVTHKEVSEVVVCRSTDSAQCAPAGDWTSGWLVFVNSDRDDPPAVDPGETVLHVTQSPALRSILSNRRAYVLRPFDRRATNGTVTFCDRRGAGRARAVIISYTGRPRVASRSASGQPLTCPA
jgi:type IV fimbrial biogenesis protein FimT